MFSDEELEKEVTIKLKVASVMLQLINRLNSECRRLNGAPAIADNELGVIGMTRDEIVRSIEVTLGKNYDQVQADYAEHMASMRNQDKAKAVPEKATKRNKK